MKPVAGSLLIATLVALAAKDFVSSSRSADAVPDSESESLESALCETGAATQRAYQSVTTCAAAACHGSQTANESPGHVRQDEFFVWLEEDPHENAYRTLMSETSLRILENLGVSNDRIAAPHLDQESARIWDRCVRCHNTTGSTARHDETPLTGDVSSSASEGVGCEACHGPSQEYLHRHYRDGFQDLSSGQKCELGLSETKNLWVRARLCAGCHVGSVGRDVDHDLIAAGHPPLKFEFAAYHQMLPPHWNEVEDHLRLGGRDFTLQAWVVGQFVTAELALEQLIRRAERAGQSAWPELAEYDCFACHHELRFDRDDESWRQRRGFLSRPFGRFVREIGGPVPPPWGTWNLGLIPQIAADETVGQADPAATLKELSQAMHAGYRADATLVADRARAALGALRTWRTQVTSDDGLRIRDIGAFRQTLADIAAVTGSRIPDAPDPVENWDRATHHFLALAAAYGEASMSNDDLLHLRELLAYPTEGAVSYQSPRSFGDGQETEQHRPRRDVIRELIQELSDKAGGQ